MTTTRRLSGTLFRTRETGQEQPVSRVVLHIDRLVLRGVDPHDAAAVAQALRAELGSLLAPDAGAALAAQGSAALRRTPPITLGPGTAPAALGRAVAGRIAGHGGGTA